MFKYTTNPKEAHFFIQSKGQNSGKPLRNEIKNSIGIHVNESLMVPDYLYYVVLNLFNAGEFTRRLKGSVIPFINHNDITEAIFDFFYERREQ